MFAWSYDIPTSTPVVVCTDCGWEYDDARLTTCLHVIPRDGVMWRCGGKIVRLPVDYDAE